MFVQPAARRCLFNSDLVSQKVQENKNRTDFLGFQQVLALICDSVNYREQDFEKFNAYLFLGTGCGDNLGFAQNTQEAELLILELSYSNSKLFLFPLTTMSFHKQQKLG